MYRVCVTSEGLFIILIIMLFADDHTFFSNLYLENGSMDFD